MTAAKSSPATARWPSDRKSTRLNSSHTVISYAVHRDLYSFPTRRSSDLFGAFNLGLRHRDAFGVVAGLMPPLNLRWQDCHGDSMAKFDPRCWAWRTGFDDRREVVARYGPVAIRSEEHTSELQSHSDLVCRPP